MELPSFVSSVYPTFLSASASAGLLFACSLSRLIAASLKELPDLDEESVSDLVVDPEVLAGLPEPPPNKEPKTELPALLLSVELDFDVFPDLAVLLDFDVPPDLELLPEEERAAALAAFSAAFCASSIAFCAASICFCPFSMMPE